MTCWFGSGFLRSPFTFFSPADSRNPAPDAQWKDALQQPQHPRHAHGARVSRGVCCAAGARAADAGLLLHRAVHARGNLRVTVWLQRAGRGHSARRRSAWIHSSCHQRFLLLLHFSLHPLHRVEWRKKRASDLLFHVLKHRHGTGRVHGAQDKRECAGARAIPAVAPKGKGDQLWDSCRMEPARPHGLCAFKLRTLDIFIFITQQRRSIHSNPIAHTQVLASK